MKHFFLKLLSAFCFLGIVCASAEAAELYVETLRAPVPPSSYSGSYKENASGQIRREFDLNGKTRAYQLYVPRQSAQPRAVVMLLHGAGRSGVSLVEKWKPIADQHNLILIGPHGTKKRWDGEKDGTDFLRGVLSDAEKDYAIDKNRIYLFGHSAGGIMALYASVFNSDIFAATAVHAGMMKDGTHYNLINDAARKIPVMFINGTHDRQFPIHNVQSSANAFALRGHEASLVILEGHNHWYYDIADFINGQAWDFLSGYQLN